ncbi:unnamed protein product [Chilo suppressalis]|uniref:Peptidase M14 domain-containing protein n=1 Tax=Chilo suppressalis TaxID=168631 RepID=A0ABN8EA81_CHISP|nr:unnamed protein product [Chilo suppressalis]
MFKFWTVSVIFVFSYFIKSHECMKYSNYTLYRGMPVNEKHLEFFRNLSDMYDVNFWTPPGNLNKPVDFTIKPEDQAGFLKKADENGIYLSTIMRDIQRAFDKQTVRSYIRRNMESFNWQSYFRFKDIHNWLIDLQKMYPKELQLIEIGKSAEGRKMIAVKIILIGSKRRSTVIVEGGIHAREWISPAFVTFMIYKTITAPKSNDKEWKAVALTYEWYFLPVVNPDGYEYSHTEDRLWRKNRNDPSVDINRNFDTAFGTIGVSFQHQSDTYCGKHAFSEPEAMAMANFIKQRSKSLEYYISFHSYGQYMIIPYAHLTTHEDNYDEMKEIGKQVEKKISRRFNTKYLVGTAYDTVGYRTSGVSGCWVKKEFRVPYVLTFELRDDGESGFALPPEQILPTCQETMDGMKTLLTPRVARFQKLGPPDRLIDCQSRIVSNTIITICNMCLFLIVRFY